MRHRALLIVVLIAGQIGISGVGHAQTEPGAGPNCARTSVGFTPLTDMGRATYHGYPGGLYSKGSNVPSAAYLKLGLAHAQQVKPRNAAGKPAPDGKIGLLSIGMSNTLMEWRAFMTTLPSTINPRITVINGAQGGQDAELAKNPAGQYWDYVEQQLQQAGVTDRQVQAVWLLEAIAGPSEQFPADARRLESDLRAIVGILEKRFPHLQMIYLSSRIYAGYAVSPLNPEPYAYQSGFAVKWLIGGQMKNASLKTPWLGWGPYTWADGMRGRKDGLTWACSDYAADGTHPDRAGAMKVAGMLDRFFTTDKTAKSWVVGKNRSSIGVRRGSAVALRLPPP